MILAAGRGKRLRPLTDTTPKPLIKVGSKRLIEYHLEALARAGLYRIIINLAHLSEQIVQLLGNGAQYGVNVQYSSEPDGALETAGGIVNALPLLKSECFAVINSDIWTDFDFGKLATVTTTDAHLILVDNPKQHPQGDFHIDASGYLSLDIGLPRLTFSGIAVYNKQFFSHCHPGKLPLSPLLQQAIHQGRLTGEHFQGKWFDAGTPESLQALGNFLNSGPISQANA